MINKIYIHHHLGLGDHIALNGLVWDIAENNKDSKIYLFCKERYHSNIQCLYAGTDITLIPIPSNANEVGFANEKSKDGKLIRVGFDKYYEALQKAPQNYTCDRIFYEMMGVDYTKRFTGFKLNRDSAKEEEVFSELNPENEDYIFVHDDSTRGFTIPVKSDIKVIRNDIKYSIFHMIKILENAKEIHCIESCFRCLVEHLDTENVKLFYHNSVRPNSIATQKKWEIL